MGRLLRVLGAGAAVVAIALSPWAGAQRDTQKPAYYIDDDQPLYIPPAPAPALGTPMAAPFVAARPAAAGGCGCATVVINAVNELREVEVRTGDAKAVNNAVTYVSAGYAQNYENEIKVKVRQVSRAISGDAMAGQSISLAGGRGARCYNYVVKARNVLQDVEVRSGDAKAANHSTILLDPGVQPDRLDIKLRQVALARAGDATAGQFIGAAQGGGGRDGCGGVRIEATNLMNEVEVRSGEADGTNDNTVRTCAQVGCADELRELVPGSDTVQMCLKDDCITESPADVVAALPAASASPLPTLGVDPGTSIVDPEPTECPRYGPRGRRCRAALAEAAAAKATPTPTAAPDESPTPTPDATVEPTPEPTPAPTTTPVAPPL